MLNISGNLYDEKGKSNMITEVVEFNRKELFNHYNSCDNPFIICTTKIDVTNVVNYCKKHKNFYATLGFLITKTANQVEAFKYRYSDGKIYYCDNIKSNYTQMYEENAIGYFDVEYTDDYNKYIQNFLKIQTKFKEDKNYIVENDLNEVWLSCVPWFTFTSLIPPFSKKISIPQFIWDKYESEKGKYYINLMIMVHHGFADGSHVGNFINLLKENIAVFK